MYNKKVLSIFNNPQNAGGLQGASGIGKAETNNSSDVVKLYIKIDENEEITESRFKTFGCVASIVCSSVITEIIIGKTVDELKEFSKDEILEVIEELPQQKLYCIDLVLEALNNAIKDYEKRKEKEEKAH